MAREATDTSGWVSYGDQGLIAPPSLEQFRNKQTPHLEPSIILQSRKIVNFKELEYWK